MLNTFFQAAATAPRIEETLTFANVKWSIEADHLNALQQVMVALSNVYERDSYELLINAGDDTESVRGTIDQKRFEELAQCCIDAGYIEFELRIEKKVQEQRLSIYFFEAFSQYLVKSSFHDFLATFSEIFNGSIHFQTAEDIAAFRTNTIYFCSEISSVLPIESARSESLNGFRDNTNATGIPSNILPSDFFLHDRSASDEVNSFFDRVSVVLSLAFLANSSVLKKDEQTFSYKIYGYKAIVCSEADLYGIASRASILNKIFCWAYEGGSVADKLGLVRNVLSIHLDEIGNLKIDENVWEAIRSNYQIYLKGNIQSYLEIKNRLSELLFESVTKTSVVAEGVLDSLKNNIFIIVTFLLTVVVINGLKDSSFTQIFSTPYLLIAGFLSLCSICWMIMIRMDARVRYENAAEGMAEVLHTNYDKFLMTTEIDASLQPTLRRNFAYLNAQIKKYCYWWLLMTGLFFGVFLIGNISFVQMASPAPIAGLASQAEDANSTKAKTESKVVGTVEVENKATLSQVKQVANVKKTADGSRNTSSSISDKTTRTVKESAAVSKNPAHTVNAPNNE